VAIPSAISIKVMLQQLTRQMLTLVLSAQAWATKQPRYLTHLAQQETALLNLVVSNKDALEMKKPP
jgi:hypothetical protein